MTWSWDGQKPSWGNSSNEWSDWRAPDQGDGPIHLPRTMTEVKDTILSANLPRTELFLGLSTDTGLLERMNLARPRSLIIDDSHSAGQDMLLAMVTASRWRDNQKQIPITIISHDEPSWNQLSTKYTHLKIASPSSVSLKESWPSESYHTTSSTTPTS
jgi:hypothetical protein